ncbi:hypothetical protein [Burkholderia stagnalis]|nr:hypothetical protein [Burkholderia stagnalis]
MICAGSAALADQARACIAFQAGYQRRGPFGDDANDPLSVFMQKHIAA